MSIERHNAIIRHERLCSARDIIIVESLEEAMPVEERLSYQHAIDAMNDRIRKLEKQFDI